MSRRRLTVVAAAAALLAGCQSAGEATPTTSDDVPGGTGTSVVATVEPDTTTGPGPAPAEPTTRPPDTDAPSTDPSVTAATSTPGQPTPTTVHPIVDFRAPLVGGGELDVATVSGTPALFWFWAPF